MRINDIIVEGDIGANPKKVPSDQLDAIKGAITMPDVSSNKSNGNPYQWYRFGIGLAVADGKKGGKMDPAGAMAGDPLLSSYTDEEFDMIKDAAEMTDAGRVTQISRNKSEEADDVHIASPVRHNAGVHKVKKSKE